MYIIQLAPEVYLGRDMRKSDKENAIRLNRDKAVHIADRLSKENPNVIVKLE
jgi:hypothetical protein